MTTSPPPAPRPGTPRRLTRTVLAGALALATLSGCAAWRQQADDNTTGRSKTVYTGLNDKATHGYASTIKAAVDKYGCDAVSPALIASQLFNESGFKRGATSPAGAQGISQFMPSTWAVYGVDGNHDGRKDVWDPADAIPSTVHYDCVLAKDVRNVPGDRASNMLAAYNAGSYRVKRAGGVPRIPETMNYVKNILGAVDRFAGSVQVQEVADNTGSDVGKAVVAYANAYTKKYTPYVWGGGNQNGPTSGGFDCSGLVMYAVYQARAKFHIAPNRVLHHYTGQQIKDPGVNVSMSSLRPGDAIYVWVNGHDGTDPDHVVIYAGRSHGVDEIIEAPRTGRPVRRMPLSEYRGKPMQARRFV